MALIKDNPTATPDSFFNGYLQPGSSDSTNDVGIRTVSQSYINVAGQMSKPRVKTPHPIFIDLLLEQVDLVKIEGEYERLDVTYKGKSGESFDIVVTSGGNTTLYPVVTSLSKSTRQEPLDSHPNFSTSIVEAAVGSQEEDPEIIIRDDDGAFLPLNAGR